MVKGIKVVCAVVGLGLAMAGGRVYAADIYVDMLADGSAADGSQEKPYVTIQAGVDAAAAGDTVWVKSGEGRDYAITDDSNAVSIPEEKSGLTLRGWGDEKVLISCTNKYEYTRSEEVFDDDEDGIIIWINKKMPPLTVNAPNVVLKDLRLVYTDDSMTTRTWKYTGCGGTSNYVPYVYFAYSGTGSVMRECEIEGLEEPGYYGAGSKTGLVCIEAENCRFEDNRLISCKYPFGIRCASTFVGNYSTNVYEFVFNTATKDCMLDATVISNTFVNCASEGGLFSGGQNKGFSHLDVSYNVFYNDETLANKGCIVFAPWANSMNGGVSFHHNTVVGWKYLYVHQNFWGAKLFKMYDNVIWLLEGGATFWDKQFWDSSDPFSAGNRAVFLDSENRWIWTSITDEDLDVGIYNEKSTEIRSNVFREGLPLHANAYFGQTRYGENLFDADWAYTVLTNRAIVSNNVYLAEAPVFVSMDVGNENFMKAKQNKNRLWADKAYAWGGSDGTAELFIGAKPIIRDTALVIRVQ